MRLEIHKLKPDDLEVTNIDKPTTHSGTNEPNENQDEDWNKMSISVGRRGTS
jgi:hypothetical protein